MQDTQQATQTQSRRGSSLPNAHRLKSISVIGGFLDGVRLSLADGLNCIIGARGTGKTTALELASLYARGHANAEAAQRLEVNGAQDSVIRAAQFHYLAGQYEAALLLLDSQPRSPEPPMLTLRKTLLKGRILVELGRTAEAVKALTRTAAIPVPAADRNAANRLRATAHLLAGEALWLERSWPEAAAAFDTLATIPGYGDTGASLARTMRALIREAAVGSELDTPS